MKDYLWVIITTVFSLIAIVFFILNLSSTSILMKKVKKSKLNLIPNILVLFIGLSNIGIAVYLLLSVREQIERISSF